MSGRNNKRKRRHRKPSENDSLTAGALPSPTKKRRDYLPRQKIITEKAVIFQDLIKPVLLEKDTHEYEEEEISSIFFELANAPLVGYRVDAEGEDIQDRSDATAIIEVKQDTNACTHTGGIVWETAYLLLQYLLATQQKLGRTLEVGAGCGLLGQVLAAKKLTEIVVMTETKDVIANLQANVERNHTFFQESQIPILVRDLDWEHLERDTKRTQSLRPHSFDTILGTDVVFTPKLVQPLLKTLKYMSHAKTNIYLCLQERCTVSHRVLLEKAPAYNFVIRDITTQLDNIQFCQWGKSLECRLFHITQHHVNG